MFLGLLEENEKKAFLKLAHYMARSDGDFSDKQREIIATYCFEMQIDDIDFDKIDFDVNSVVKEFKSTKSKKIALLEIMALVFSDNILHREEEKIIDIMLDSFEFDKKLSQLYAEWTKSILAVSEQGKILIEM